MSGLKRSLTLILTIAAIPLAATADQFVWQKLKTNTEYISTINEIASTPERTSPCPKISGHAQISERSPPVVSDLGTIHLDSYVTGIAWAPNGKLIATSEGYDRFIKIWSYPKLKLLQTIDKQQSGSMEGNNLGFTLDSKDLITSSAVPFIENSGSAFSVIDVASGKIVRNVTGYEAPPHYPLADEPSDFHFSIDGKYLFVSFNGDPWNEYVFDTATWSLVDKISGDETAMAAGPGLDQLSIAHVISLSDGVPGDPNKYKYKFLVWDQKLKKVVFQSDFLVQSEFPIQSMAYDSDGCFYAFGSFRSPDQAGIKIWFPSSNRIYDIPAETPVYEMAFSRQQNVLGFIENNNKVGLLFIPSPKGQNGSELSFSSNVAGIFKIAFNEGGNVLAIAGDREVAFYNIGNE